MLFFLKFLSDSSDKCFLCIFIILFYIEKNFSKKKQIGKISS